MLSPPRMTPEALRHHLKQLVADLVPQVVVHVLEAIEIDEQSGHLNVRSPSPSQHLFGAIEDEATDWAAPSSASCMA